MWHRLTVEVHQDWVEAAEARFEQAGAVAVSLLAGDAADELFVEHGAHGSAELPPLWQWVRVQALFETEVAQNAAAQACADAPPAALRGFYMDSLGEDDWHNAWRQYAVDQLFARHTKRPLRIAARGAEPRDDAPAGTVTAYFDPGLAFGSGSHPTTAMCLEWLAAHDMNGLRLLDYGCGSGILGVSAACLGAAIVVGIDIDPLAVVATQDNAAYNHVMHRVVTGYPDGLSALRPEGGFDVVMANILANPLVALAEVLQGSLAPEGMLVLSGILEAQAAAVQKAYPDVIFNAPVLQGGWVLLSGRNAAAQ